jgi:hypothetical protein
MIKKYLLPIIALSAISLAPSAFATAVVSSVNLTPTSQTSLDTGNLTSDSTAFILKENSGVSLATDLIVGGSGTYNQQDFQNGVITPTTILAGTVVDSYLLHFNPSSSSQTTISGSVSFDGIILGVIYSKNTDANNGNIVGLAATDPLYALPLSSYPTSGGRGIFDDATDSYGFVFNSGTLNFTFSGSSTALDEIRILVDPVPEPIHYVMAGVAALVLFAIYRSRETTSEVEV